MRGGVLSEQRGGGEERDGEERDGVDDSGVCASQPWRTPLTQAYLDDAIAGTDDAFLRDETDFVMPSLPAAEAPYEDSDRDGMADAWEREHGLVGERGPRRGA